MSTWIRDRGLLIANLALFVVFLGGMILTGAQVYSDDQVEHGHPPTTLGQYLRSSHVVEATFENWESEFLQMGMYVVLTAYLFQRGSSESKPVGEDAPQDADPRHSRSSKAPWPVRQGGFVLVLYEHSLALLFFALFALSTWLHAAGGAVEYSQDQIDHGAAPVTTLQYLGTSQFWFESFQNWQSEFLAVAVIVWASVYLRYRGSAESKPVAAPHRETGA
jgi:hypothetical protein